MHLHFTATYKQFGCNFEFSAEKTEEIIPGWPWYLDKCETGSAVGGSKKLLPNLYTVQECIDAVRKQYHAANGFTMNFPCGSYPNYKCNCVAVFAMKGWNSHQHENYKTCRFHKGKDDSEDEGR